MTTKTQRVRLMKLTDQSKPTILPTLLYVKNRKDVKMTYDLNSI